MSWYIEEKLKIKNTNQATLEEMKKFLTLWDCICGTCPVCLVCLEVHDNFGDGEE